MSQDNVEVVREAFEAFNRGDFDAALERMHPAIEWQALDAFPDAGTYRGRDEVRHFWEAWRDTFHGFLLHLHRLVVRTRIVSALEKGGQLHAQGLALGGVEVRVVEPAGAFVGGLVVVGLLAGGFESGDRRLDLRADDFLEPSVCRVPRHLDRLYPGGRGAPIISPLVAKASGERVSALLRQPEARDRLVGAGSA